MIVSLIEAEDQDVENSCCLVTLTKNHTALE